MTELMRWRMFGYLTALFIAGFITGAAVMKHMTVNSQSLKVGRSEEIANLIRQKLIINLELTPQQREKIDPLIKKTAEEMEASHLDCLKRITAAADQLHEQISPELSAEQREKLKRVEEERRAKFREKYNYPPETAKTGN